MTHKKPIHSLPEKIDMNDIGSHILVDACKMANKINSIIDWLQAEKEK